MAEKKELSKDVQKELFAPEDNVTRAEFVTMLARLLELETPAQDKALPFKDVSEKDWFYGPIKTAYNYDLVKGKGEAFDPNGLITRGTGSI